MKWLGERPGLYIPVSHNSQPGPLIGLDPRMAAFGGWDGV